MIWFVLILLISGYLISSYNIFLLLLNIVNKIKRNVDYNISETRKFIIIIPAHNEENELPATLHSCRELEYPNELYQVIVIADNCTDATVEIAQKQNIECFARFDDKNIGKGYALSYAFDEIKTREFDAVIVLDADCLLSRNALNRFAYELDSGENVLQAKYVVSNSDESPTSYMFGVGNYIENEFYWSPKSNANLVVFLRGTGMVLKKEIITDIQWEAHSIVEDVEYTLLLLRKGINVRFIDDVVVSSKFPVSMSQMKVQRERWAEGNYKFGLKSIYDFFINRSKCSTLKYVDLVFTFLTLSRPFLLVIIGVTLLASLVLYIIGDAEVDLYLLIASILLWLVNILYFIYGIVVYGMTWKRAYLLVSSMKAIIMLIIINVRSIFSNGDGEWKRTPRENSQTKK